MRPSAAANRTATHLCEIEGVLPAEADGQTVLAADVETPVAGDRRDTWALPVTGWVVGRSSPARHVVASHRDAQWTMPVHDRRPDVEARHAGTSWARYAGFSGAINLLRLPPAFELEVTAETEDGARSPIAKIAGRRALLRTGHEPQFRPLMVTTLGRTGSTWLVHLLGAHPDVVAYRPFSFEPRAATYWVDVLTSLADPSSYTQQVEGEVRYPGPWWLGAGTRMTSELVPDDELSRWLGAGNVTELAAFAQQRLDALYRRIAAASGSQARLFAEKCLPRSNVPQLLWELYPDAREVFLVRDFRDMLCSIKSFDSKRSGATFGRGDEDSDESYAERVLAPSVRSLLEEWRARADTAHLVRYEDLIRAPADTLAGTLDYLGVGSSPQIVEEVLARASQPIPGMAGHSTAGDPDASVGRWRRELDPALAEVCDRAFGEAFDEFGYERAAAQGSGAWR